MTNTETTLNRINNIINKIDNFEKRIITDLSAYNYDTNITVAAKEYKTVLLNIVAQLRSIANLVGTGGADSFPNLDVLLNWYNDYAFRLKQNLPFRVKLSE